MKYPYKISSLLLKKKNDKVSNLISPMQGEKGIINMRNR